MAVTQTYEAARPRVAFHAVRVSRIHRLTPHMTRITFAGDDLHGFEGVAPDQYVKVFFPLPGQQRPQLPPPLQTGDVMSWYRQYLAMPDRVRPPMRTYTIRARRPHLTEVDIDFAVHDNPGPACTWAAQAQPGDEVILLGPSGIYDVPEGTGWQLLVGDESAVPAVGAILEALPPDARAEVFLEVGGPEHRLPFETLGDVRVHWIEREGAHGESVLAAVRAARLPDGTPYAWLAGEASLVKFARRHLVRERGIDKRAITFTGYWRQGRSEDQVSRESVRRIEAGEAPVTEEA
jgi:NADPH-dependent ferric siderophore reductase